MSTELTEIQSQKTLADIFVCRFPHLITARNTRPGEELSGLIIISLCFIILGPALTVLTGIMKRIFWRSGGGKEKEEEIQDVSLDIVLANKEDIIAKVGLLPVFPSLNILYS